MPANSTVLAKNEDVTPEKCLESGASCLDCERYKRITKEMEDRVCSRDVIIAILNDHIQTYEHKFVKAVKQTENFRYKYCTTTQELSSLRMICDLCRKSTNGNRKKYLMDGNINGTGNEALLASAMSGKAHGNESVKKLEKDVATLEATINELKFENVKLLGQNRELNEDRQRMEDQMRLLVENLQASENQEQRINAANEELRKMSCREDELETDIRKLKQINESLKKEHVLNDDKLVKEEFSMTDNNQNELQLEVETLKREINELKEINTKSENLNEETKKTINFLKDEKASLTQSINNMKECMNAMQILQKIKPNEIIDKEKMTKETQTEADQFSWQLVKDEFKQEDEIVKKMHLFVDEFHDKVDSLLQINYELRKTNLNLDNEIRNLKDDFLKFQKISHAKKRQLDQRKPSLLSIKKLWPHKSRVKVREEQFKALNVKINQLMQVLQQPSFELRKLREENQPLLDDYKASNSSINEIGESSKSKSNKNEMIDDNNDSQLKLFVENFKQLEHELASLKPKKQGLEDNNDQLKDHQSHKVEPSDLIERKQELERKLTAMKDRLDEVITKKDEIEALNIIHNRNSRKKSRNVKSKFNNESTQINSSDKEDESQRFIKIQKRLENMEEVNNEVEKQLKVLEHEIDYLQDVIINSKRCCTKTGLSDSEKDLLLRKLHNNNLTTNDHETVSLQNNSQQQLYRIHPSNIDNIKLFWRNEKIKTEVFQLINSKDILINKIQTTEEEIKKLLNLENVLNDKTRNYTNQDDKDLIASKATTKRAKENNCDCISIITFINELDHHKKNPAYILFKKNSV